ncbi:MAG: phage integrase N-terminal SAM-like domain-containing protein [Dehalococcoidia bacterium]|nr:phage integrase N-terminal SAM-like domain-containing protein [Dehalococcoidia bacterium]
MVTDVLPNQNYYTRAKLTGDVLSNPISRILGSSDLWGRLDYFITIGDAQGKSPNTSQKYRYHLSDFVRFMNSLSAINPDHITEEHITAYLTHKRTTCGAVT